MRRIVPGDLVEVNKNYIVVFSGLDAYDLFPFHGSNRIVEKPEKLLVVSVGLTTPYIQKTHLKCVCALVGSDGRLWFAYEDEFKCVP